MSMETSEKYSRFSKIYDAFEYPIERLLFHKLRAEAVSHAQRKTLEVGVGTGKNLPYYNPETDLTAMDFSPGMLEIARKKHKNVKIRNVQFFEEDVQSLSFDNEAFDTVISTFVFCTVPDPVAGLKEVYRVLRPTGKAIFLEHMKSENSLVNIFLYMMNVFSTSILGTSMIRETQKNIEAAGFKIESVQNKALDVVRLIIAEKSGGEYEIG
jgi:ubiquinone/menaquinone biosynthesis C-methylase UbiE